jgi:hypothetical protein
MGMFSDLRSISRIGHDIGKTWDPGAQMRKGTAQMQVAMQALSQQTSAMELTATGESVEVQVLAARDTGTQLNLQPMFELDLLVTRLGLPPYPVTIRQVVSMVHAGRIVPGAVLPARIDPTDPGTVLLGL